MVNRLLLRKLQRDIFHRKGALFTLVIIMTVGVGVYVGMAGVYRDLDGSRSRYYREQRLADFYVDLRRAPEWTASHVAAVPNVRAVRGRISFGMLVDLPGQEEPITGTAISMPLERRPVLNDLLIRAGTWFSNSDAREVILNDEFANANGIRPGNRIKVTLLDQQHDLLVVGTAMSPEFVYLISAGGGLAPDPARFGVMYMPERFLQEACDLDGAYNQFIGLVHNNEDMMVDNTLELISDRLDAYGVTNTTASRNQVSVNFLRSELQGLKVTSTITPAIFLGVAALVLNVLLSRMVVQQRNIIGTLMALGYTPGAITRHYLTFAALVGGAGGVTGVAFGMYLQTISVNTYRKFYALPSIVPHLYPDVLVIGLVISVVFAVAGTVRAVYKASKLEPAEAMRPPPPEKGGAIIVERLTVVWRRLPFRWKMIMRAVFRNPFRSGVSVVAGTLATSLVLMTLATVDCLDFMMGYEFQKVSHQDFTVSVRWPVGIRGSREIGMLPGTSGIEPQLSVVCDLSNGPHRKRLGVTGISPGNRLYTPLNSEGRPVTVPDEGLVLGERVAGLLHVEPGDRVHLRSLIGRREEVTALVVATVDTYFGLMAYADLEYLSRLLGEEWAANTMLGTWFPGALDTSFLKRLKQRPTVIGISRRLRALTQLDETFGKTLGMQIVIMVFFAGAIAFGSVLNAALVSLSERRREVGTLRVIGYTPFDTARIFSGESFLLNGLGIMLGLFGGVGLLHLMAMAYSTELFRWPVVITIATVMNSILIMVGFIVTAQLIIYRLVHKMNWLDVLKVKE